jgi:hypothetical protein
MTEAERGGTQTSGAWERHDAGNLVIPDDGVSFAIELVDRSGVVPQVDAWRRDERVRLGHHPGGRPERFPSKALWVAQALAGIHNLPMLATEFLKILFVRISPAMRELLAVPEPPPPEDWKHWQALYRCIRTRLHAVLEPIDPSGLPKNLRRERRSAEEFDKAVAQYRIAHQLTDDVLAQRWERLTWVQNALIEATWSLLPRDVRQQWDGSLGLDATAVPAFARPDRRAKGNKPRSQRHLVAQSADPDAGLYTRTQQHDGASRLVEAIWAFEAEIAVAGNANPDAAAPFPPLVAGVAPLHRPGADISRHAVAVLRSIDSRGHPAGFLAVDRGYTNLVADDFQLPARALGFDLVMDYRDDQLGVQGEHEGFLLIEGDYYCPGIPDDLKNATVDVRAGRIDEETHASRIKARLAYKRRPKANPDAEGHTRCLCPASDGAPTARCELKPRSIERTTSATTRIHVTEELRLHPPKCCTQQSVTLPPEAGAKLLQDLHYASPEWHATYHTLRNTIEGMNGIAKDGAYAALADARRRRIRGVAAQSVFVAMLLFGVNIRTITSLHRHARQNGRAASPKRRRRRASRPLSDWGEPPGRASSRPRIGHDRSVGPRGRTDRRYTTSPAGQ